MCLFVGAEDVSSLYFSSLSRFISDCSVLCTSLGGGGEGERWDIIAVLVIKTASSCKHFINNHCKCEHAKLQCLKQKIEEGD